MMDEYDAPLLIGVASSGSVRGYRVEVFRCRSGGWDIFYFNPGHEFAEYNSWAEEWEEVVEYGAMYRIRWTGGSQWNAELSTH